MLRKGHMTNGETNAKISYRADLLASRGCATLASLATLGALRLLWLARGVDGFSHSDSLALGAAILFLGVAAVCVLIAVVIGPKRPPATHSHELPNAAEADVWRCSRSLPLPTSRTSSLLV